jgi:hypothetical protein
MDRRVSEGSDLKTIRHELASAYRMKSMGYQKPPTLRMLQTHQEEAPHPQDVADASGAAPGDGDAIGPPAYLLWNGTYVCPDCGCVVW